MPEMNREALVELFRKLGAPDPTEWAHSQLSEGINQLGRFVFLRQAWRQVVPPDNSSWIDSVVEHGEARPLDPGAAAGPALQRMLDAGASRDDIHQLVRSMQSELLFAFCYLLEDPGELEQELTDMCWALVQTDHEGRIIDSIAGLHESVLETDPAARKP